MTDNGRPRTRASIVPVTLRRRIMFAWVQRPALDWLALLIPGIWLLVTLKANLPHLFTSIPPDIRRTLYQTLIGASATFAGFTLTSVSILINLLRTPLSSLDDLLTDNAKRRVGSVFIAAVPALGIAFFVSVLGLLLDSKNQEGIWFIQAAEVAAVVACTLAIARLVWVTKRLLIVTKSGA